MIVQSTYYLGQISETFQNEYINSYQRAMSDLGQMRIRLRCM
jgi:hypothetical protein